MSCTKRFCSWPLRIHTGSKWREKSASVVSMFLYLYVCRFSKVKYLYFLYKCIKVAVCVFLFVSELKAMFKVKSVPTVVVLRPDGSVLSPNAVQDICSYGTDCFRDWQESAEVIERSFMLNEDFDNLNMRSATDPVRRLKYKTEDDKRKKRWWKLWVKGKDENEEEEKDGAWDRKRKDGDKGIWRIR